MNQSNLSMCKFCSSHSVRTLYEVRDYIYGNDGSWTLGICDSCQITQILNPPSTDKIGDYYPKDYYSFNTSASKLKKIVKKLLFPTLLVADPKFSVPGKVLDYGCGNGAALSEFQRLGWDCAGIEPSQAAVEFGSNFYGLKLTQGISSSLSMFESKSFDYIRANHSLEHDPDAAATFAEFRRLIKDDGKLLIGVPNINGLNYKIFKKYWWYICAPVHMFHYSTSSLRLVAKNNGFIVTNVRYTGNFTGLLGSISVLISRNDKNPCALRTLTFRFPPFVLVAQFFSMLMNIFKIGDAIEVTFAPISRGVEID